MQKQLESWSVSKKEGHILRSAVQEGCLQITLNRPKRSNAFTPGMYHELILALAEARADPLVTSVLLQASGKNFSSGNDLANFKDLPLGNKVAMELALQQSKSLLDDLISSIVSFPKPLFALVHGKCIGFTFTMLSFFDGVWATEDATFEAPFAKILQNPQFGSSDIFPQIFGYKITR